MKLAILTGILAVQVLVVGIVFAFQFQTPEKPGLFLEFDPSMVDALSVVTPEETIELRKLEDQWQLSERFPADQTKVEKLIEKLADLDAGWPVATSGSTAERFEVTSDNFQKHVTLKSKDDVVAEFYLGTSPGYQRVHARTDGPVHSVKLSNYEFGSNASAWLNKQLLRPEGRLGRIEKTGEFVLTQGDEGWSADLEGELDVSQVNAFAERFSNLTVFEINEAVLPSDPKSSYTLLDEAGEMTIDLYFVEEDEDWVAVSSRVEGQFGISTYIAEDMNKDFADLIAESEEDDESADTDSDNSSEEDTD